MFKGSLRRVTWSLVVLAAALVLAAAALPPAHLVMALNGAMAGAAVGVFIAYRKLAWHALGGGELTLSVAVYVISVMLLWAVAVLGAFNSIALRVIFDLAIPTTPLTIVIRIIGITAAVLQVAAPDMRSGIFFTRDTRLLFRALIVGAVVGLVAYIVQWGGGR